MLESALEDILATKGNSGCGFAQWIAGLDEHDQQRLTELLQHPNVTADDIVAVLAPHYAISSTTVRRHRRWVRHGQTGCGCQ